MVQISAALVKELRLRTDAPMMECKKALLEADGDIDKGEEILRVRLGNKATKAASRITCEGLIGQYISNDGLLAAMVEVNCETDFVARHEDFCAFVEQLAHLVCEKNPANVDELNQSIMPQGQGTVEQTRVALVGKIGENITLRRFSRYQAQGGISWYVHMGNKIGVLVDFKGDDALAKDIAMHIAAMKPQALTSAQIPEETLEKERTIARKKALESNKPAAILEKIVQGHVQKFLKEVTLLGQPFVKNDKQTVADVLAAKKTEIYAFTLYVVGQGLDKKTTNFADEVAEQIATAS